MLEKHKFTCNLISNFNHSNANSLLPHLNNPAVT